MAISNNTSTFDDVDLREDLLSRSDALNLKLNEEKAAKTIGRRIENSESSWNSKLNLQNVRKENEKRWLNENFEVSKQRSLYNHEVDYRDNRIFVSVETLTASVAAKTPTPEVYPAQDTDASRELAEGYGKVLTRKSQDLFLKQKLQMVTRHLVMGYRIGIMKTGWDFDSGALKPDGSHIGECSIQVIRPHKLVIEEDTESKENISLIAENITSKSVEELAFQFPDKKDEIINKLLGEKSGSL